MKVKTGQNMINKTTVITSSVSTSNLNDVNVNLPHINGGAGGQNGNKKNLVAIDDDYDEDDYADRLP